MAMLVAVASATNGLTSAAVATPVVAGALLLSSLLKSSQFPVTGLFVRSMEGPTPASSLGYAGLSAHVGIVMLSSTIDFWF
jgi:NADH-quinone oxidoreductase subunit L